MSDESLDKLITFMEQDLEKLLPQKLEQYFRVYSSQELITRQEFQEANLMLRKEFQETNRQTREHFDKVIEEIRTMAKITHEGILTITRMLRAMETKMGREFEIVIRELFREALTLEGIVLENVRRLTVYDPEGVVVDPGDHTDIDIFAHNNEVVFIEIKSSFDVHDLRRFEKTIALAEAQEGLQATKRIAITLNADPYVLVKAQKKGIKIIAPT